jgi:hypothetical protein
VYGSVPPDTAIERVVEMETSVGLAVAESDEMARVGFTVMVTVAETDRPIESLT